MIKVYQATDIGPVRPNNEDSLACVDPNIYVVADGMGGCAAGEVASGLVVKTVQEQLPQEKPMDEAALKKVILQANEEIRQMARRHREYDGMGTTATLLHIEGDTGYWAHVGDSRLYLCRDKKLQQVTGDHSLVAELVAKGSITPEEAHGHPQRNIITRAVGIDDLLDVDTGRITLVPGDILLLCSDGLTSAVGDESINTVLAEPLVDDKAAALVALALKTGTRDNVSVIVVCYEA